MANFILMRHSMWDVTMVYGYRFFHKMAPKIWIWLLSPSVLLLRGKHSRCPLGESTYVAIRQTWRALEVGASPGGLPRPLSGHLGDLEGT